METREFVAVNRNCVSFLYINTVFRTSQIAPWETRTSQQLLWQSWTRHHTADSRHTADSSRTVDAVLEYFLGSGKSEFFVYLPFGWRGKCVLCHCKHKHRHRPAMGLFIYVFILFGPFSELYPNAMLTFDVYLSFILKWIFISFVWIHYFALFTFR